MPVDRLYARGLHMLPSCRLLLCSLQTAGRQTKCQSIQKLFSHHCFVCFDRHTSFTLLNTPFIKWLRDFIIMSIYNSLVVWRNSAAHLVHVNCLIGFSGGLDKCLQHARPPTQSILKKDHRCSSSMMYTMQGPTPPKGVFSQSRSAQVSTLQKYCASHMSVAN